MIKIHNFLKCHTGLFYICIRIRHMFTLTSNVINIPRDQIYKLHVIGHRCFENK